MGICGKYLKPTHGNKSSPLGKKKKRRKKGKVMIYLHVFFSTSGVSLHGTLEKEAPITPVV